MSYPAESATMDVLSTYYEASITDQDRSRSPENTPRSQEPERTSIPASPPNVPPVLDPARHRHVKAPSRSSPFYWNWPPQVSAWEEKRAQTVQRRAKGPTRFWHGWKVIVFGSCAYLFPLSSLLPVRSFQFSNAGINILLVIVPISVRFM